MIEWLEVKLNKKRVSDGIWSLKSYHPDIRCVTSPRSAYVSNPADFSSRSSRRETRFSAVRHGGCAVFRDECKRHKILNLWSEFVLEGKG